MTRIAAVLLCAAAATASDVLFVHVGKTCGGTIAAELRKNRVAYHEVHLDKLDRETLAQYKHIIVSARDPVERVVSAFNWRSPHACRERKGECTPPRAVDKYDGERGLYNCFADVQHFVDAVTGGSKVTTLTCHMLAHSFFYGVGVGAGGGSHIGKGLSWYIGPVLHELLRRESDLWVVRAEACEHDLEGGIRWLRGDDTLDVLRSGWVHPARNTTDETSTTINSSSRKNLQRRLEAEYQILQLALDASVNYGAKRRRGLQKELLVDGGGVCKSLSTKTHVNTNC